jgi:hypothetical protein
MQLLGVRLDGGHRLKSCKLKSKKHNSIEPLLHLLDILLGRVLFARGTKYQTLLELAAEILAVPDFRLKTRMELRYRNAAAPRLEPN